VGAGAPRGDRLSAFLQKPFGTFSLTAADWLLTTALAFSIVPVLETVKWMARRGWFGEVI
jgi:hypothetical protein